MGLTFNLGRVSPSVFTDSSLNVGIGAAPSGTYKLEVTGTAKVSSTLLVSGAATLSSTLTTTGIGINYTGTLAAKLHITAASSTSYAPMIALRDPDNPTYGFTFKLDTAVNGDMRIDRVNAGVDAAVMSFQRSTGNVGIGTSSPSQLLDIQSSSASAFIQMSGGSSSQAGLNFQRAGANKFQWVLNSDDSLNAYNYTTSSINFKITSGGITTIYGNSGSLVQQAGAVNGDVYYEFKNSAGSRRAYLGFGGASSSVFDLWNSENGDIKFGTNNTEKMRLFSTGKLRIATPISDDIVLFAQNTSATGYGAAIQGGSSSSNYSFKVENYDSSAIYFRVRGDGNTYLNAAVFNSQTAGGPRSLYISGAGESYYIGGLVSIRAAKKNIENVSNIDWIYQLNPVTYYCRKKDEEGNFTEDIYDDLNYGLIAEDTAPIADFLINYDDREEGSKKIIGIEYSRLIIPMLKAIQELSAQNQDLKSRLDKAGL